VFRFWRLIAATGAYSLREVDALWGRRRGLRGRRQPGLRTPCGMHYVAGRGTRRIRHSGCSNHRSRTQPVRNVTVTSEMDEDIVPSVRLLQMTGYGQVKEQYTNISITYVFAALSVGRAKPTPLRTDLRTPCVVPPLDSSVENDNSVANAPRQSADRAVALVAELRG